MPVNQARSEASKKKWQDPAYRERISLRIAETMRKKMADPNFRNRYSVAAKNLWTDPDFRTRNLASRNITDETKQKISDSLVSNWQNEDYRKKMSESISKAANESFSVDPTRISDLRSQVSTRNWQDPSYRKKMMELMPAIARKKWESASYRAKMALVRIKQPKTSQQQSILYSILDDLNVKYFNDKSEKCAIGWYVWDCRIDPQPGINITRPLLIEVNGDYWHNIPTAIRRDKAKASYLKTYFNQFDNKYLWEHEFIAKERIINLIKYWLGITKLDLIKFNFNEITLNIVKPKDAEIFISKYHYAGRIGNSSINIGYYIKDVLIAVAIYSYPVRQETATKQGYQYKEVLELSRFCIHPAYQVKNLASHLISRSISYIKLNYLKIKCLVSFADSTYNHFGTIYKASNWKLDGEVSPDYWYVDKDGYVCHKKTLWNKANGLGLSEQEYSDKFQYKKVYGDKKYRYVYVLQEP